MNFIKILLLLIIFPAYANAQRFAIEDLKRIRQMDVSEASSYFESKGWKLFQTRKNPDTTTEIFWTKGENTMTMFRYILTQNPNNSAVSIMYGDKSKFEALKKEAKNQGMTLTDSGVDGQNQIYSVYTSSNCQLRFSTSADKERTYYEVFLIVKSS